MPCCGVLKCSNRTIENSEIRFFTIPKFTVETRDVVLNVRQRIKNKQYIAWIKAINRISISENVRICSKHFSSSKPAHWCDVTNIDWIPHIDMGYNFDVHSLNYLRVIDNPSLENVAHYQIMMIQDDVSSQTNEVPISSDWEFKKSDEASDAAKLYDMALNSNKNRTGGK